MIDIIANERIVEIATERIKSCGIIRGEDDKETWTGSAWAVTERLIVTNAHVVNVKEKPPLDPSQKLEFSLDGKDFHLMKVISVSYEHDLALCEVSDLLDFIPIPLGDSDKIKPGETIVNIGSPLGFDNVVSVGYIGREPEYVEEVKDVIIFLDINITPGSSGSVILNLDGECIAISEGGFIGKVSELNYGIPVNVLKEFMSKEKIAQKEIRSDVSHFDLVKVIAIVENLLNNKIISNYAIGGSISSLIWSEATAEFVTKDVDIFTIMSKTESAIVYPQMFEYLRRKGYQVQGQFILVGSTLVDFIDPYNSLTLEALQNSSIVSIGSFAAKVFSSEYSASVDFQTGIQSDGKRLNRMMRLIDSGNVDKDKFLSILSRHNLLEIWNQKYHWFTWPGDKQVESEVDKRFEYKRRWHKDNANLPLSDKLKDISLLKEKCDFLNESKMHIRFYNQSKKVAPAKTRIKGHTLQATIVSCFPSITVVSDDFQVLNLKPDSVKDPILAQDITVTPSMIEEAKDEVEVQERANKISIIGPPGCGKKIISEKVAERLAYPVFGVESADQEDRISEFNEDLTNRSLSQDSKFVISGYPQTITEAENVYNQIGLDYLIVLKCDREMAFQRIKDHKSREDFEKLWNQFYEGLPYLVSYLKDHEVKIDFYDNSQFNDKLVKVGD